MQNFNKLWLKKLNLYESKLINYCFKLINSFLFFDNAPPLISTTNLRKNVNRISLINVHWFRNYDLRSKISPASIYMHTCRKYLLQFSWSKIISYCIKIEKIFPTRPRELITRENIHAMTSRRNNWQLYCW